MKYNALQQALTASEAQNTAHREVAPLPQSGPSGSFRRATSPSEAGVASASAAATADFARFAGASEQGTASRAWVDQFHRPSLADVPRSSSAHAASSAAAGAVPQSAATQPLRLPAKFVLRPGKPLAKTSHPSGNYVENFGELSASADGRYVTGVVADGKGNVDCHLWDLRRPNVPSHVVEGLPLKSKARIVSEAGVLQVHDHATCVGEVCLDRVDELGMAAAWAAAATGRSAHPAADAGRFYDGRDTVADERVVRRDRQLAYDLRQKNRAAELDTLPVASVDSFPASDGGRGHTWRSGAYYLRSRSMLPAGNAYVGLEIFRATRHADGTAGLFDVAATLGIWGDVESLSPNGRYLLGRHSRAEMDPRAGEPFVVDCWRDAHSPFVDRSAAVGPYDGSNPHTLHAFAPDATSLLVVAAPKRNAAGSRGHRSSFLEEMLDMQPPGPKAEARLFDLKNWGQKHRNVAFVGEADLSSIGLLPGSRVLAQRADEGVLVCAAIEEQNGAFSVALPAASLSLPKARL